MIHQRHRWTDGRIDDSYTLQLLELYAVHTPPQLNYHILVQCDARGAVFRDAVRAVCAVRCFVTP